MLRTLIGTDLWIEQTESQAFNLDTILLASFAKIPYRTKQILDIGTGVGGLMLYLSQKTNAKITGIEIQANRYEQALKNIQINHLETQLSCVLSDVRALKYKDVDYIITNPPFFKVDEDSHLSMTKEDLIARHEINLTLEELIKTSASFLKNGGYIALIHRPDRFEEIARLMEKYDMVMKRIRFVHPYSHKKANHILVEAMKKGKPGLIIEPPMILYHDKHIMTKELIDLYGGKKDVTIST
ncbi:MAG: methyltransferase [Acholeplasmataceae bacterium]|jgi:tRNA1(Val) A37 N6-methylase TrmN6|nr:methyltransferase [Acholeplasmataceae bacterium]MDY0338565.1 methyltransferase [Acholeplasmataceae bacterium]